MCLNTKECSSGNSIKQKNASKFDLEAFLNSGDPAGIRTLCRLI